MLTNINAVSSNLVSTGLIVDDVSGNLITTGQSLQADIAIVSGIATGGSAQDFRELSGNLITTGQTLQSQITSNDDDISDLSGNLSATGQTLTSLLVQTGNFVDILSGNLITTGNLIDSEIAVVSGLVVQNDGDISTLQTATGTLKSLIDTDSTNLISTGNFLNNEIATVSGIAGGQDLTNLSGKVDILSGNLITTGQTLASDIAIVSGLTTGSSSDPALSGKVDTLSGNLITTGQTLQTQITSNDSDISTLTSNLGVTGQTLQTQITSNDSDISTITSNLATTGQTLQTQITSNDSDISTLTSNLVTTGQTLTSEIAIVSGIAENASDEALSGKVDTLSGNLITTGQTLQTQITSNDSDITSLTSNLVSTGQTLTTDITTVSGLIVDNDGDITALKTATGVLKTSTDSNTANLITTGQTLQTQITSNDGDISTLTTNLGTTGQNLQTQITSNDSDITTLTSNLITTGQTLTTDITTVSGLITDNDADITALKSATGVLKTSTDANTTNLITTGQTLQTQITSNDSDISTLTTNLGTTGQTLQTQITSNDSEITSLTSNLITTGQTLTTDINTVSGLITDNDADITALKTATGVLKTSSDNNTANLITTGQTLQTQITSNDGDITTLTSNLATTGQTLQTQITSNDGDITTLTSNLVTTGQTLTTNINTVATNLGTSGQTLQTQITSNDSDISTLTSNLGTTGQTLQTQITSNDSDIASLTTNLGTTGQTLQTQITSNDSDISTLDSTTVKLTTNQSIAGNKIFTNDVTINNLTVTGTEVVVDVENLAVKDNIIEINSGESSAGISRISGGIVIDRGTATNANILYNDANDRFELNFPLAVEGEVVASASNLITTGQTLTTNINTVSTNLGTSGQTLQTQITSNDSDISTLTTNLGTTGQTLQTQITSNDSDISTLTTNLGTTGQTLQTQITSNDSDISTLTTNLGTTGQTLQTQITSNDSDISTLTSNLVTTGQTLTTNINTVSTNLGTSGQTLQTQITSNDTDITNLSSNLVTTGQTLTTNINTVATNLVTTGQTLTSEIATVSGLIPATVIDGGGTANKVPLWSDANTIGDSVISQSSSKIGIGTASPSNILHVKHADPAIRLEDSSPDGLYGLLDAGGGDFIISADGGAGSANSFISFRVDGTAVGSEKMRITSAGKVGIGTNAPSEKLHIVNSSDPTVRITNTDGGTNDTAAFELGVSTNTAIASTRIEALRQSDGSVDLNFRGAGTTSVAQTSAQMTLDGVSGAVGINTTSPNVSSKLHVYGWTIIQSATNFASLRLQSTTGSWDIDNNNGTFGLQWAGGDKFNITSAGSVGIGINAPDQTLHVNSAGLNFVAKFESTDDKASILIEDDDTLNYIHSQNGYLSLGGQNSLSASNLNINSTNGSVGIGTETPGYKLDVNGTAHIATAQDSVAPLTLKSTYNGSTAGPLLDLYRKSGTPADGDNLGTITFTADTNVGSINEFARIESTALDVTDTTEDGALKLAVVTAGTLRSRVYMDSTETVFNDASQDFDFRVESDNSVNALFVQGSSGNVGIGTGNPPHKLSIYGTGAGKATVQIEGEGGADPYINFLVNNTTHWAVGADDSASDSFKISQHSALGTNDRITVLSGGSVGIGTNAPSTKLHVAGDIKSKGDGKRILLESNDYLVAALTRQGTSGSAADQGGLELYNAGTAKVALFANTTSYINNGANFGIGTASPQLGSGWNKVVHVHSPDGVGSHIRFTDTTSGATGESGLYIGQYGNDSYLINRESGFMALRVNGTTDAIRILAGGNVGIGTNSPATLLDVTGGSGAYGLRLGPQSDSTTFSGRLYLAGSSGTNAILRYGSYLAFTTGATAGGASGTVRMVVLDGGSVGIGTNAPSEMLHINKSSGTGSFIRFQDTGGGGVYIGARSNVMELYAGGAERMRIASDGNVGVGETSPDVQLHVKSSSSTFAQVRVEAAADGHDSSVAYSQAGSIKGISGYDDSTNTVAIKYGTFGGSGIDINSSGNVGIGTNSPAHKLEVYGGGGGTFGAITNRQSANANTDGIATVSYDSGNQSLRLWVDANGHRYLNAGTTAVISFTTTAVNIRKATTFSSGRATFSGTAGADGVVLAGGESTSLSSRLFFDNGTAGQAVTILNNSGGMEFRTAGTPGSSSGVVKMTLSSAGNLGIGITPTRKFHVSGSAASAYLVEFTNTHATQGYGVLIKAGDDNNVTALSVNDKDGNEKLRVRAGGEITFANAFTFPTTDGSSGQTLQTDGSGNVTWSSAGTGTISGSGTDNYIPRFNGTSALENSAIYDNGSSRISLGTVNTSPWQALHVQSTGSQFSDGASGNNNYNVVVLDQNAYTSNYGGGILFGGKYNNAGNITTLAMVSASKVNGDGNFGGKVHIGGREHGTSNIAKVLTVTHDNVGIGTVTPAALLHVDGQAIIDALHFDSLSSHFIKNDGNLLRIAGDNGVKFQSYDGGWQTRMTIVDDGNVGIGTISPDNPLEVFGADSGIKISSASNNRPHLRLECGTAEKLRLSANTVYGAIGDSSDTNRYMAFKDGNIGIATVTPGVKLHVAGQGLFANNGANIILANSWSSGNTDVLFGGSGVSTGSAGNTAARIRCLATAPGGAATGSLTFTVNSGDTFVDALYIKENGNVGIGTNAPVKKLDVRAAASWDGIHIGSTAGSATAIDFARSTTHANPTARIGVAEPAATHTSDMRFFTSDASGGAPNLVEKMRINQNGIVIINDTATTNNNNARLYVNGPVYGSEFDLPSGGVIDWSNGDARIVEGLTSNYSLSLQNYDGSSAMVTTMFLKSGGNVGIGTVAPAAHLHVSKASGTTTVLTQVAANSTVGFEIKKTGSTTQHWKIVDGQTANGTLEFYDATNSATRMAITGSGSVGLNKTPNSQYNLDIEGQMLLGGHMSFKATNSLQGIGFNRNVHTGAIYSSSYYAYQLHSNANNFELQRYNGSGTFLGYGLVCTATGNIGIGTNNPLSKLNVLGTQGNWRVDPDSVSNEIQVLSSTVANDGFRTFRLRTNETIIDTGGSESLRVDSGGNLILSKSGGAYVQLKDSSQVRGSINVENGSDGLVFTTGSSFTERMRIKSDGNVGIGHGSPNAKLSIKGDTEFLDENTGVRIGLLYDNGTEGILDLRDNNVTKVNLRTAGDSYFTGGNVGIGTNAPLDKLDVYGTGAIFRNLSDNADSVQIVRGTNHTANPDAKFYIYDNSSADWAAKINLDGASYGLDIQNGSDYFLLCRKVGGDRILEVHGSSTVVNDSGIDYDFRVESNNDDYLLYTDGGNDRVAISTNTPAAKLHVEGDFKVGTTNNGNWMGYKDVSLNGNTYTTALTINLNNHTGCYVKLFLSGDWSSHSAVAFVGEYFVQNGSDGYAEPGTVISEFDNTNTDSIESKIVDPSSDTFTIQLKLSTAANGTLGGKLSYHVMGMATAVS